MADRLGQVLQAIRIPDDVLAQLEESLLCDKTHEETLRKRQAERMHQRLTQHSADAWSRLTLTASTEKSLRNFGRRSPPSGRKRSMHS